MKTLQTRSGMRPRWLLSLLASAALVACGGGGTSQDSASNDSSDSTTSQDLVGKVMDGYIKGAIVCLDVNSNGVCDTGEPSVETGEGGAFTLAVPETATLGGPNLVVNVPADAVDEDTNTEVGTAYDMRGVAASSTNVSPLTTLLAIHMDSGKDADAAAEAVMETLGLTGIDVHADYVADANHKVHNVGKVLAKVFQNNSSKSGSALIGMVGGMKAKLAEAHGNDAALTPDAVAALAQADEEVVEPTNLITNGDFESGATGWSNEAVDVRTEGGNSYNFVNVAAAGDSYNVNINYVLDIPAADVRYKLSFDAWSDKEGRKLIAGIGLAHDPWTAATENFTLTTTSQPYEVYLTSNFAHSNSRVLFDMGHDTGVVGIDNVVLELAPDDGTGTGTGTGTGGETTAAPTDAPPTPPVRDAQDVVSIFSGAYTNVAIKEWGPNWGESSSRITDITIAGEAVKVMEVGAGQTFAAIDFSGASFDASGFTHLHIDVWVPEPLLTGHELNLKLSNHDGGASETNAIQTTVAPVGGQWQSVDIALDSFTIAGGGSASRNAIAQFLLTSARSDTGQPAYVHFDNFYFYKSSN